MIWYFAAFANYANFSGRARRKEYWFFALFNILVALGLLAGMMAVSVAASASFASMWAILYGVYFVATIIPSLSVTVRRLHDTGRSGWWYFIGLVPVIGAFIVLWFTCEDSQRGDNEYGPSPKYSPFAPL